MSRTTSELGRYVREYARELGGHKALSAGASRYGVANNMNHLQDEMTQQPVNMAYPASGTFSGRTYYEVAAPTPGVYSQFGSMPPAPVFLRFQSDGSSSRIVVKLRAYSATDTKAVLFRVILRKFLPNIAPGITPLAPYPPSAGGPEVADLTTSSSTPSTLTATLYISRLTDAFLKFFPAVDGSGGVSNVRTYMAQVEVWGSSNVPVVPRIEALSCREWIGA